MEEHYPHKNVNYIIEIDPVVVGVCLDVGPEAHENYRITISVEDLFSSSKRIKKLVATVSEPIAEFLRIGARASTLEAVEGRGVSLFRRRLKKKAAPWLPMLRKLLQG